MKKIAKADACMALIENTFNFNILGSEGFSAMTEVVDKANCYDITYPNLEHALGFIGQIIYDHHDR